MSDTREVVRGYFDGWTSNRIDDAYALLDPTAVIQSGAVSGTRRTRQLAHDGVHELAPLERQLHPWKLAECFCDAQSIIRAARTISEHSSEIGGHVPVAERPRDLDELALANTTRFFRIIEAASLPQRLKPCVNQLPLRSFGKRETT